MNSSWSEETKYVLSRLDDIQKDLSALRDEAKVGMTEMRGELKGLKGKVAVIASFISATMTGAFTGALKKMGLI